MVEPDQDRLALMAELAALRTEIVSLKSQRFEKLFFESETLNINDQEALEIILQESEERFLCIADNTPVLIWMAGLDKGCFYFNQPWLNFTGRCLEQEQGDGWLAGVHPEDLPSCLKIYGQAFDARQPFTIEYRLRNASGEYYWLLGNGVPRFTRNGKFLGYVGSCIDITDRRTAYQQMEKSEEKYRTLVESVNTIIVRWLPTGKITFMNQYGQRFFGFKEEEIVGKSVLETVIPKTSTTGEDLEAMVMDICLHPEQYQYHENENVCKNGDRVWVAWTNKPIFDGQGQLIELFASGTDITARKLAQDQLNQRESELMEAQRLAKLGRWRFELASGDIHWSEEIFRMFGRDPRSRPTYAELTASIHPGDRHRHQAIVDKVMATGQNEDLAYRFCRQDGTQGWLWTRIEAVHNLAGELVALQGVAMDITGQKKAETELEKLNQELEERVSERTQALAQSEATLKQVNEQLNIRLNELKRRNEEMEFLSVLNEYLQCSVVITDICSSVAALSPRLFPDTCGAIFIFDAHAEHFEMIKSWGDYVCSQPLFKTSDCWALRRGQIHCLGEQFQELFCSHFYPDKLPKESLCLPLIALGKTLGLLNLSSHSFGCLGNEQQYLAKTVAEQVSLAIANVKLREKLEDQSVRDPLTGLFNRRYLEQFLIREIGRAHRYQNSVAVLMADVDHFKSFNDQLGHDVGDRVLRLIGRTLQKNIRASDVACRYGGEEFTLVLPETALAQASAKAEELRQAIAITEFKQQGEIIHSLTLSFGVACYPDHGETSGIILKAADMALYQAKNNGRNCVATALTCLRGLEFTGG
jgi:hypothetical protein